MKFKASFVGLTLAALAIVSGCATSHKQRVVTGVQVVSQSVDSLRSAEMSTFDSGVVPELTLEKHKAVHAALVKYYDAEEKFLTLLKSWQTGQPAPVGLIQQLRTARDALTEIGKALPQSGMQAAVNYALASTTSLLEVLQILESLEK